MSGLFGGQELVRTAIQMERNGESFYNAMTTKATDEGARKIFARLAAAERQHIKDFTAIGEELSTNDSPMESYEGEVENYASALLYTRVFSGEHAGHQMAEKAQNEIEAVHAAIAFEKDAILFLHEMRSFLKDSARDAVEKLLKQEQQHIVSLSELLKELGG